MPSSRNSSPSTSKPKPAYHAASGACASRTTSRSLADLQRGVQQRVGEPLAARRPVQGHPADPPRVSRRRRAPGRSRARRPRRPPCTTCRVSGSRSRPSRSAYAASCSTTKTSWRSFHRLYAVSGSSAENGTAVWDPHSQELLRPPPGPAGLGEERQDRVDVDQARLLDVGQRPAGLLGAAHQQPAAGPERVAGAEEHQRRRQPGQVAEAGRDLGPAEVVGRAGPPLGVGPHLADEQPRVALGDLVGLRCAGGQVHPRRDQQQVARAAGRRGRAGSGPPRAPGRRRPSRRPARRRRRTRSSRSTSSTTGPCASRQVCSGVSG